MAIAGRHCLGALIALFVAGCAITGHDLVTSGDVVVRTVPSATARFLNVRVIEQAGGKSYIAGEIMRSNDWRISRGEVHIDLFDSNGKIVGRAKAAYMFRRSRAQIARLASFYAILPVSPPIGGTVVIGTSFVHE